MAKKRTRIIKSRLGPREITDDKIIYFPKGLIGFDDQREFTLLDVSENSPFMILQCLADANLGLLVADPYSFMDEYNVKMGAAEKKILKLKNIHQIAVLVTVSIPKGEPEKTTLNLAGPIVINTKERIGLQVPQTDANMPSHFRPGG